MLLVAEADDRWCKGQQSWGGVLGGRPELGCDEGWLAVAPGWTVLVHELLDFRLDALGEFVLDLADDSGEGGRVCGFGLFEFGEGVAGDGEVVKTVLLELLRGDGTLGAGEVASLGELIFKVEFE